MRIMIEVVVQGAGPGTGRREIVLELERSAEPVASAGLGLTRAEGKALLKGVHASLSRAAKLGLAALAKSARGQLGSQFASHTTRAGRMVPRGLALASGDVSAGVG